MFLLDNDILSTFAKIERMDLLFDLFGERSVAVTGNVVFEINKAIEIGLVVYEHVLDLVESGRIRILPTTKRDLALMRELPNYMGAGERDSFAICKNSDYVLVTDDRRVIKYAHKENVSVISLHMILRAFWVLGVCSRAEVRDILKLIQEKDRKIIDIEIVLNDSL